MAAGSKSSGTCCERCRGSDLMRSLVRSLDCQRGARRSYRFWFSRRCRCMGLFSPEISTKTMVPLCRQLATAYEAGVPIIRSLEVVGREFGDRRVRDLLAGMRDDLRNGYTLGGAAEAQQQYLPRFFIQLLATGEHGGKLDVMLRDLADYYEDRLAMRRKLIGIAVYPILQLTAAWFLGSFALLLIRRVMAGLSGQGGGLNLYAFFNEYVWFQTKVTAALAIVLAVCVILSRAGLLKWIGGWIGAFVWPLAPIVRKFALARFFRSMSLLIGSGMNIVQCIENSAAIAANPYIQQDLLKAVRPIKEGATLLDAFRGSRFLTPTAREMLAVGEESGQLEQVLRKVSDYHVEEASHAANVATRIGEVTIIVVVALVIGYIVISFYANLYGRLFNELGV